MGGEDKVKDLMMISRITEVETVDALKDVAREGLRDFCRSKGYNTLAIAMEGAEDKYQDSAFLEEVIEGHLPLDVRFISRLCIALDKVSPGTSLDSFIPFRNLGGEPAYRGIAREIYGDVWDFPIEEHHQEALAILRLTVSDYAWAA